VTVKIPVLTCRTVLPELKLAVPSLESSVFPIKSYPVVAVFLYQRRLRPPMALYANSTPPSRTILVAPVGTVNSGVVNTVSVSYNSASKAIATSEVPVAKFKVVALYAKAPTV